MNAVSYVRCSSSTQTEGDSYPRQDDKIAAYSTSNGHVVDICFMDDVSGTNEIGDRPGFFAMLEWMKSNGRTLLLVEGAHRFARDLLVQELSIMELQKLGITVIEVEGGNDLTDDNPTKTFIRQILGAHAQLEKSMLVAKLKAARDREKRQNGKCEGSKRYGEREGDDPEVIDRIVMERDYYRLPYHKIAERLNADEVPTQRGGRWSSSTVRSIYKRAVA